jgi:hypothetical protein
MTTATVPQRQAPPAAFPTTKTCSPVVMAEDVDYLVEVLRLDIGKSESDLDDEVLKRASALGIVAIKQLHATVDATTKFDGPSPALSIRRSRLSFPASSFGTAASSASLTSASFTIDTSPTTTPPTRSSDSRRWSESLELSLYDDYLSQLEPGTPKSTSGGALNSGESTPTRSVAEKKGGIATLKKGFRNRILKKKATPTTSVTT